MKSFKDWMTIRLEAKEQSEKEAKHKLKKVRSKGYQFPSPYYLGTTPDEDDQGGEAGNDEPAEENLPGQEDAE